MKHFRHFFIWLLVALSAAMATAGFSAKTADAANAAKAYRILFISSYNYSFATVPDQLNGFAEGLDGVTVDIVHEFMDAKNYFRAEDIAEFHDYIKFKIDNAAPFDLVVLGDDTALHFGMNYADELFPGTPIVFLCVNNLTDARTAAAREGVTGIAEIVDFQSNVALFTKLFPGKDHFVVVLDNSNSAQGEFVEFEKYNESAKLDYDVINASYYSQKGLTEAFAEIDDKSLVLFLDILSDGEGNIYTTETSSRLLTENAPDAPVIRVSLANVGNGVLGGVSYSYYDAGIAAGQMAAQILTGTDPDDIPIVTDTVTETFFEQNAMDHFRITKSDLPPNAIILNEHQTPLLFYQQHKTMMNLIFAVILLMIVIIFILILFTRKQHELIHQDYMTKIPNRTYITERLAQTLEDSKPFGLIMMDVDHFKSINDTLGHLVGDELLIEVARRLKALPKEDVIFARIGGDEFMGFLNEPSIQKANQICRDIVHAMHQDFDLSCGIVNITVSIGVAMYPIHTKNPGMVQNLADKALYEVKEKGRDGYVVYHT